MAWRKEQREAIEALEDAEAILWNCMIGVSRQWNMAGPEMSKFCSHLDEELARVHARIKKARSSGHPGGLEYSERRQTSKSAIKDIEFALREIEMVYRETGCAMAAVAEEKLKQALEKLGAGDGSD